MDSNWVNGTWNRNNRPYPVLVYVHSNDPRVRIDISPDGTSDVTTLYDIYLPASSSYNTYVTAMAIIPATCDWRVLVNQTSGYTGYYRYAQIYETR